MNKQTHAATGSTPPSKAQLDVTIEQVRRLVAKLKEKETQSKKTPAK